MALGSVKSNIGHLKGAPGAAGLLKTCSGAAATKCCLPACNCEHPNPDIDFDRTARCTSTPNCRPWAATGGRSVRRAGVSAFGFRRHELPRRARRIHSAPVDRKRQADGRCRPAEIRRSRPRRSGGRRGELVRQAPLRGALVIGAATDAELPTGCSRYTRAPWRATRLLPPCPPHRISARRSAWQSTIPMPPNWRTNRAKALKASDGQSTGVWKALRAQGIFRGHGPAPKVAFLYTGQGSQYVNMLRPLASCRADRRRDICRSRSRS